MKTAMQAAFEKAKIMITSEVTNQQKAFLTMIAISEGTKQIPGGEDGYKVLVGSTPKHPLLFNSYTTHPRIHNAALDSDAAGRYQLMGRYFAPYAKQLGLTDFSPKSQDQIALQQIKECHALADIETGNFASAVEKVAHIWASFPGKGYAGQHQNDLAMLKNAFISSGGIIA